VDEYLSSGVPNKNDPKYQTLPYNAKFTPFGVKHELENYQESQHLQDQAKFDKAMQQMQIITLDHPQHHQQQPQLPGNNKLMNSYSMNFQQLHQVLSQNHQNTKSANSTSNAVIAEPLQQSAPISQPLLNGTGHHLLPRGKSMSAIGSQETESGGGGSPIVRPTNFLSTAAPSPTANSETNGLFNSQVRSLY